jgi:hypothetical protein
MRLLAVTLPSQVKQATAAALTAAAVAPMAAPTATLTAAAAGMLLFLLTAATAGGLLRLTAKGCRRPAMTKQGLVHLHLASTGELMLTMSSFKNKKPILLLLLLLMIIIILINSKIMKILKIVMKDDSGAAVTQHGVAICTAV